MKFTHFAFTLFGVMSFAQIYNSSLFANVSDDVSDKAKAAYYNTKVEVKDTYKDVKNKAEENYDYASDKAKANYYDAKVKVKDKAAEIKEKE